MRSVPLLFTLLITTASACGGSTDADSTRNDQHDGAGAPDTGTNTADTPGSRYDANGDARTTCASNADCAAGEQCVPIVLYSTCASSGVGGRTVTESGSCSCLMTSDCGRWSHCVPVADFDVEETCFVSGQDCSYLSSYASAIAA